MQNSGNDFRRLVTTTFWLSLLAFGPASADHHEFTMAVLPDTQTYTARRPQIMEAQIDWITLNRITENIVFVGHLGDLKDVGACVNGTLAWPSLATPSTEWEIVRAAFNDLDLAGIPYGVAPGNHDFDQRNGVFPADSGGCPNYDSQRPLVGYNTEFDPTSFVPAVFQAADYGTRLPGSNEDNFTIVSSNGVDFIFINIGYQEDAPPAGSTLVIDWAETLLTNYPNHIAIVNSHYLMDCNASPTGTVVSSTSSCAPAITANQLSTYGANIVDRLRAYPNFFMMIGGHRFGEAYTSIDRTAEGYNPVHAVLANYQHLQYSNTNFDTVPVPGPSGGTSGYFKLMRFDMDSMTVDLDSLSPVLAAHPGITGSGSILPVLSSGNRATTVFSPRDIDITNPAALVDAGGDPTLHSQSVSNLVNISFAGYGIIGGGTTTLIDFETRADGSAFSTPGDNFPANEYPGVNFEDSDPLVGISNVSSVDPINVGTSIAGNHLNLGVFAGVDTRLTLSFGPDINAIGFDYATPNGEINVTLENGGVPVAQLDFIGNDEFINQAGFPQNIGRADITGIGDFDTVIIEPASNQGLILDNLEFTTN